MPRTQYSLKTRTFEVGLVRIRLGLAGGLGGGESPRLLYLDKLSLGKAGNIEDIFLVTVAEA